MTKFEIKHLNNNLLVRKVNNKRGFIILPFIENIQYKFIHIFDNYGDCGVSK